MRRSAVVAAVVILGGIVGIGGSLAYYKSSELRRNAANAHAFEPAEAVQVVRAREIQWRPTANLVGTVISRRSITVSNERAGTIADVRFDSGAVIEAGQVLLTLDDFAGARDHPRDRLCLARPTPTSRSTSRRPASSSTVSASPILASTWPLSGATWR